MKWNPVLEIVNNLKEDYIDEVGQLDTLDFDTWLSVVDKEEYNDFFSYLQVNQHNEFILIRYGLAEMQEGMWINPNSPYRECRSVVIDLKNDCLVLTPFRKFFNIDEVEENKIENIRDEIEKAITVEVTDKLDGSMQNARWYNGDIFMTGSQALSPEESWRLQDGINKLGLRHKQMMKDNPNLTFIFEYISLDDAHVVMYNSEDEGLYLVGMRSTSRGVQLDYEDVISIADDYGVKHVEKENKTLDDLLKEMDKYSSDEKEGWVLNIDGEHLIKVKCDDYVYIHRILDDLSSVNVIMQSIADESYDDLISKVPEKYIPRVERTSKPIFKYVKNTTQAIKEFYKKAPKGTRKEFMIWVENNVPKEIVPFVKSEFLGKEYNLLTKGNGTGYKKMNELHLDKDYLKLAEEV